MFQTRRDSFIFVNLEMCEFSYSHIKFACSHIEFMYSQGRHIFSRRGRGKQNLSQNFPQNVGKILKYRKKGVKNDKMYKKRTRERKNFEENSLKSA